MKHMAAMAIPGLLATSEEMISLRRRIHGNPELGYEEFETSDLVAERLQSWGYEVHRGLGGTGVVGRMRLGSGGKRLGLRADMDALLITEATGLPYASRHPGKMHACGHDGHTATLLAAAHLLSLTRCFDGTLNLIFQPAEEGLGGARRMIEDGLFERFPCDAIYAFHNVPGYPAGRFGFREGVIYNSSDTALITVHGRGGHGAVPHTAVDPIVIAAHLILALQSLVAREVDPNDFAVVTVGAIHAGQSPNVIPASAELRVSVRARSPQTRLQLRERITTIATSMATLQGGSADVDYRWRYPPVVNDAEATAFARSVALACAGEQGLISNLSPQYASDDFAFMLERVPGSYFIVGNGDGSGAWQNACTAHNPGYDFNDEILPTTAEFFVRLAQKFLAQAGEQ
jgi:hippurate hydrolase